MIETFQFDDVAPNIGDGTWSIVLAGDLLLYKIPWCLGTIFGSIIDLYVRYINEIGNKVLLIPGHYRLHKLQQDFIV